MKSLMRTLFLIIALTVNIQFTTARCLLSTFSGVPLPHNYAKKYPIKKETSKIVYSSYSNSGAASVTSVTIYRDSVVWEQQSYRGGYHYRDALLLPDENDFNLLIEQLSQITFKAKDAHNYASGGRGYAYSFFIGNNNYFHYNSSFKLKGDYLNAETLIQQFIENHQTKAQTMLVELCKNPDELRAARAFDMLPEQFEQFLVK